MCTYSHKATYKYNDKTQANHNHIVAAIKPAWDWSAPLRHPVEELHRCNEAGNEDEVSKVVVSEIVLRTNFKLAEYIMVMSERSFKRSKSVAGTRRS